MRGLRTIVCLFVVATCPAFAICQDQCTLHIADVFLIDGTSSPGYRADICVYDHTIGRIDTARKGHSIQGQSTIDAGGLILAPGFIDMHAHGDPLNSPEFENFLAMGVTTICLGQDGSSPSAASMDEWMREVNNIRPGVNIVMFGGHGTLRRDLGEVIDDLGMRLLLARIDTVMQLGCFGISTGLEYLPGRYASTRELLAVAGRVGAYDGMIMSHVRNEDDDALHASINELIAQGDSCRVHIAHLKSVYGRGSDRANEILSWIHRASSRGVNLTADMYPYTASYTGIGIVFPPWAKTRSDFETAKLERAVELRQYLKDRVARRNGPEATLFGGPPFTGKTLAEVAAASDRTYMDVLMNLGPQSISAAYFIMDSTLQDQLFIDASVMASSDGSPTMHHPRGYGAFARILRYYVIEQGLLSWEAAIHKMTGKPANILGLHHRGLIREGYVADLVLINPKTVRDMANYSSPHVLAEGFVATIVNGKVAHGSSKIKQVTRSGQLLRRQ